MSANNAPFCIDTGAYCVWDDQLDSKNLEFIRGVNQDFFAYQAKLHERGLSSESDAVLAATALRIVYGQAAEAALALTFAALQAPFCAFAWLEKYRVENLEALCEKVRNGEHVLNRLRLEAFSWWHIARRIFLNGPSDFVIDGVTTTRDQIVDGYGYVLERVSADFLDPDIRAEYNAFKHGFRASPGGFSLGFRMEKTPGVEDTDAPLQLVGASKFGSRTFTLSRIGEDKRNLSVEMRALNWDAHSMVGRIALIAGWIGCLKACLLTELSSETVEVNWTWMRDHVETCKKPWSTSVGAPRFTMRTCTFEVPNGQGPTADEIRATYAPPDAATNRSDF